MIKKVNLFHNNHRAHSISSKILVGVCSFLLSSCYSSGTVNKTNKSNKATPIQQTAIQTNLNQRQEVQDFIKRVVKTHGLDENKLNSLFSQVTIQQTIIETMNKPAEKAKPWYEYQRLLLTQKRINEGACFYQKHKHDLLRAEEQYGVNSEIIAAIIGVETSYGANKGKWKVIDALSTLAFDYPRRSVFFTKELESFLLIAEKNNENPLSYKGSYAGAMGYPQFMPSSYQMYAVDFDNDGKKDLWNNPVDAIGSVGNYLAKNGWQRNGLITEKLSMEEINQRNILLFDQEMKRPKNPKDNPNRQTAVTLEGEFAPEYWMNYPNFYSITRYNHSLHYAMVVYQLSKEIKVNDCKL